MNRAKTPLPELSSDETARYARHLILPGFGVEGQRKLKAARVLMIGTGGLGAPVGLYLAAAGVGHLGLVDFDQVDISNLQRQVIHGSGNIGMSKVRSAEARLRDINPLIQIEPHEMRLDSSNALDVIRDYDMVVDCSDNYTTRYLINDACVLLDKPDVFGSVSAFTGQATVFWVSRGPCYRCLFPEPPTPGSVHSSADGGVLGALPGLVGTIQANEVIKLITGNGQPLVGRLLMIDASSTRFRELSMGKDPACPICGKAPTIHDLKNEEKSPQ
ncbi:MAG TPA: molybdopterin-synthase adenylyltransferase MoeB [Fibrobacteraceae bacterium]|nr:molybdopterin-synthase adenylyltransferase MoeB [Fibrobacteraceae bacterium]